MNNIHKLYNKRKLSDGFLTELPRKKMSSSLEYLDCDSTEYSETSQKLFDVQLSGNGNKWQKTISNVVKSVVSLQFAHVYNFDTETASVSEATGFVVDAKRGLILTNRHIAGPGPFSGHAIFYNHEEVVVKSIYTDPVHDFGFLQFDPKCVKYMQIAELELRPDLAIVGAEIRIIGNDAGEKLSILTGFISRLDRNAPDYGILTYNDFNTEYIQAAASASGGSSGSPVVNEDGYAIALQAGGSTASSTDYFLPVYRPLRALRCIQNDTQITRGDIQVEWLLKPFEECRRLGLTPESEAKARGLFPDKIGLLVAELVLSEGPADGLIKEGDTLISINGEPISTFIKVDEILDLNVGKELKFVVQRGGIEKNFMIKIGDLHVITPDRYVEVAGAFFNNLSYQIARFYCIPIKGVFVSHASGSFEFSRFEKSGWILELVDDKPTPNLDSLIEIMKQIPDRQKVPVKYRHVSDLHTENIQIIHVDRHWMSNFRLAIRNDKTGLWDYTTIQEKSLPPIELKPTNVKYIDIPFKEGCSSLVRLFVQFIITSPIPIDSYPYSKEVGYGVIIDPLNGYVLVSRRFVPHDMCDVSMIFAGSIEIPGEVVFLHPNLNYAIVKYDPKLVLADIKPPKFSDKPLKRGENVYFVGYNYSFRLITGDVKVGSIISRNMPMNSSSPRYRGTNLECVLLDNKLCQDCSAGVVADSDGTIRSFWITYLGEANCDQTSNRQYNMGLDVIDVLDVINSLKKNIIPNDLRILNAEFTPITILQGRIRGVSQEWISKFEDACDDELKLFSVARVSASKLNQAPNLLKIGDIILTVDGTLVQSIRDFKNMYFKKSLKFKIIRQKKELDLVIQTVDTESINTSHVIFWCGLILQVPHHGVLQLMEKIPSEIYVTGKSPGSPANKYGIDINSFVTHVNDIETKDLESFINIVKDIPDETCIKLRLVSFDNVPMAISIKTDYHYFPTSELKKANGGIWENIMYN